jgi:alpha-glucosidase
MNLSAAPHHDGSPLYVSTASPALGETVRVRVRVPQEFGELRAVRTRSNPDHEPRWSDAVLTGSVDGWDWWEADVVVHNPRHGYRWLFVHADGTATWLNQAGLSRTETLDADDFALVAGDDVPPAWMADSVMYQIFPDRFARSAAADAHAIPEWAIPAAWSDPVDPALPGRSQQFYGGDLDGVIEHLDHLERLGVTLVYLTPVFPGASNHRYDASSFTTVDPLLGGDDALVRLVEAAHARGMKVIGDLTSNHSGDRHEWFQAALGHPEAPEGAFYYFLDAENRTYESWLGTASLPKFDWSSPELRRRFIEGGDSVVAKWLKPPYSLDGWRIDVANMTGRLGAVDLNAEVRQTIRRTMVEVNPDTILLAESTNDATSDVQGDAWHGAMTYTDFTRPVWGWLSDGLGPAWIDSDGVEHTEPWFFGQPLGGIPRYTGADVVEAYTRFTAGIPWRMRLGTMHPLDTHDTARFSTHAAPGTVPVAVGLSMTLPGIPVVWAGDEFGLTGGDGENSRTPLPWDRVEDSAETIDLYSALIGLRRAHPVLATGGLRWLQADDDTLLFVRESAEECLLVLASRGDAAAIELPDGAVPLYGDLTSGGPVFAVWALPGLAAPAWRAAP